MKGRDKMIILPNIPIKILVLNDGKQIAGTPYRTIRPYQENGQMGEGIWFEVIKDGKVEQRVNSAHIRQVVY